MKRLFLALVVAAAASPALAADSMPAAFHGDWCSVAGNDDLYRRGRCPKVVHGIHITADGYSDDMGNCQVTGLLEAFRRLQDIVESALGRGLRHQHQRSHFSAIISGLYGPIPRRPMCGLDSTSVIRRAILDRGGLGRLRVGAQKEEALD